MPLQQPTCQLPPLAKIPPGLASQQVLSAVTAINVLPLIGLVLLWRHYPRPATVLIFVPLAIGLGAGGSEHFLSNEVVAEPNRRARLSLLVLSQESVREIERHMAVHGTIFRNYMQQHGATHTLTIVPTCGHDPSCMYGAPETIQALLF